MPPEFVAKQSIPDPRRAATALRRARDNSDEPWRRRGPCEENVWPAASRHEQLPQPTDVLGREKAHWALYPQRSDRQEMDFSAPALTPRFPPTLRHTR